VTALGIALLVLLVVVSNSLWVLSIRYAAERATVRPTDHEPLDVLVHREGVMLYTRKAGWANGYTVFPTAVALGRHWWRRPWRWVVRVRPAPFPGQADLVHETFDSETEAQARADCFVEAIEAGEQFR